MTIILSDAAARRIAKIVMESGGAALAVRLEVLGGGCSGYQYKFGFAESVDAAEDVVVEHKGAKLLIDKTSMSLIDNSEIDYGESLMESGFRVRNPQATSSCGCGSSFAVQR